MRSFLRCCGVLALAAGLSPVPVRAEASPVIAKPPPAGATAAAKPPPPLVQAEAPPFSDGIFPCSGCHADLDKNRTRRELGFHDEQQSVFDHDAEHRWCLDCHDLQNRDVLRLASGDTVPFTESYRL